MTSDRREGFYIGFSSPSGHFFVLCACLSATIVGRIQQLGRAWTGPCLLCSPIDHQWGLGGGAWRKTPAVPIVQDSDWLLPVSGTFSLFPASLRLGQDSCVGCRLRGGNQEARPWLRTRICRTPPLTLRMLLPALPGRRRAGTFPSGTVCPKAASRHLSGTPSSL